MEPPNGFWDGVLRRLEGQLPRHALEAWIEPLEPRWSKGELSLRAPGTLCRDRVEAQYRGALARALEAELGRAQAFEISTAEAGEARAGAHPEPQTQSQAAEGEVAPPRKSGPDMRVVPERRGPPLRQQSFRRGFDSFLVSESNALAREASLALAQGRQSGLSPLCLVAGTGLGKTHLARALVAEARTNGRARPLYASAERFTTDFTSSLHRKETAGFKRRFREECDLLVLEDLQFLAGKRWTQLELFHTIEHLQSLGTPVVITADRLPREIDKLDERLVSQIASGLVAEIEPPDAELRRRILRARASGAGIRVPDKCLERLATAVEGSVRDLEGVFTQLVATASLLKRPIDSELTEGALRKVGGAALDPVSRHTVQSVLQVVTSFFGVRAADLRSRSRKRSVLEPRQLAMYFCHRLTDASLAEIGRAFDREHSSVRYAVDTVERSMLTRATLRYRVEELASRLRENEGGAGSA
ncbi:MAG: chromosomal replication initiator protein DnaA [Myxococcales bacterium]|nr:chromosomal replication initiator protein DnaA [Myxococcales bacterium]